MITARRWLVSIAALAFSSLLVLQPVVAAAGPGSGSGMGAGQGQGPGAGVFSDVGGYGWAMPGIRAMQFNGWMNGVGPGQFAPGAAVTRAQMAAVLGRALGWQLPAGTGDWPPGLPFTDLGAVPDWARAYMAQSCDLHLMLGVGPNRLGPNDDLTWPQLAVIAARALKLAPVAQDQVPGLLAQLANGAGTPDWAREAVAQMVQARIMVGPLLQLYGPDAAVTRAALAQFMFNLQQADPSAVPGLNNTTEVSGAVTAVSVATPGAPASISVNTSTGVLTYQVSADVVVFVDGTETTLADVKVGDTVVLLIGGGVNRVVLIEATSAAT